MPGGEAPGLLRGERWYVARRGRAVYRLEVTNGVVVDAAPVVRAWAVGLRAEVVLARADAWSGPFSGGPSEDFFLEEMLDG